MRRFAVGSALVVALSACAPATGGPVAPIAREQFGPATALDASSARQAVVDFVNAYAAAPTEGVGALAQMVAGPELSTWVRWLDVQHREFSGSIEAASDIRDVEFVEHVRTPDGNAAQVGLSATVTFDYAPLGDDPFQLARILDGPVVLAQTGTGRYHVIDLLRDGVPMSDGIQLFRDESRSGGQIEVFLDSLFMFPPNWQFNVVIRNSGTETVTLDPAVAGLYVSGTGTTDRLEGLVSDSLTVIPPGGTVEGILAYELQDSAEGRVLTLAFRLGRRVLRFEFPLEGILTVVPPPPPTDSEDPEDVSA